MIAPESSSSFGFAIESTASYLIMQIPQLDGETGARASSVWVGYALRLTNIPEITIKNIRNIYILSVRMK
jgi:hypothetical protein